VRSANTAALYTDSLTGGSNWYKDISSMKVLDIGNKRKGYCFREVLGAAEGMKEAVGEVFPDDKYRRCTVHFYRNVFSVVPKSKVKIVAKVLKTIHTYESKKATCVSVH